jgi:hypothetical protein
MPQEDTQDAKRSAKEERVEVRFDPELARRARAKAESRGWSISSVIRALVGMWVDEDIVDPTDVGSAAKRAPRTKKKRGRKSDAG